MKIYDAKQDNQKGFLNRNVNSISFNYFIITLAHGLKPFFREILIGVQVDIIGNKGQIKWSWLYFLLDLSDMCQISLVQLIPFDDIAIGFLANRNREIVHIIKIYGIKNNKIQRSKVMRKNLRNLLIHQAYRLLIFNRSQWLKADFMPKFRSK